MKLVKFKTRFLPGLASGLLLTALSQFALGAGLNASLNSTTVSVNEPFELTIETKQTNVHRLDLAALKEKFHLLGSSQMMQTQVINGQSSSQKIWTLTLVTKALGEITIPQVTAGNLSSNPLKIKVVSAAQMPKSVGITGISVQTILAQGANKQFHPYQEIPLTVRIETNQSLQEAQLIVPENDAFELTQRGADKVSHIVKNGQSLKVFERQYLLRPQQSGSLTLAPFVFSGKVAQSGNTNQRPDTYMSNRLALMREFGIDFRSNSGFGLMQDALKPFQVRSDPLSIEVAEVPSTAATATTATGKDKNSIDWFLPAKAVEITGQWQKNANNANNIAGLKVGEPIVRKITLTALGAATEQLPKLIFNQTEGVKIYVDSSKTEQVVTEQGTVARQETLISIIPTRSGEISIPAIEIPWLNTHTNKEEVAVLPALSISVAKGKAGIAELAKVSPSTKVDDTKKGVVVAPKDLAIKDNLPLLAMLLGSVIVFIVLLILVKRSMSAARLRKQLSAVDKTLINRVNGHFNSQKNKQQERIIALKKALESDDTTLIYRCLLAWLRVNDDPKIKLALAAQIALIEEALFNEGNASGCIAFNLKALKKQLKTLLSARTHQKINHDKNLPALYPD